MDEKRYEVPEVQVSEDVKAFMLGLSDAMSEYGYRIIKVLPPEKTSPGDLQLLDGVYGRISEDIQSFIQDMDRNPITWEDHDRLSYEIPFSYDELWMLRSALETYRRVLLQVYKDEERARYAKENFHGDEIRTRIIDLLKEKNMSQGELAKITGVTQSTISRYVCGKRFPDIESVIKMAGALGVTTDYLLFGNRD